MKLRYCGIYMRANNHIGKLKLYKIYAEHALYMECTSLKRFEAHLHMCGKCDLIILSA